VAHGSILRAAEAVRLRILKKHGSGVLSACYTGHCTCDSVDSLQRKVPSSVVETAVYTRDDGIVDWRYCKTDNPEADFPVSGTQHIGLAFNPSAYTIIADRLAQTHSARNEHRPSGTGVSGQAANNLSCPPLLPEPLRNLVLAGFDKPSAQFSLAAQSY
jgi:hypothetical protein